MFDGPADRAERLTRMRYQELTFVLGAATASDDVAILGICSYGEPDLVPYSKEPTT